MLAWGLVGVLAAVLAKAPFFRRAWAVCAYGFLAGFLYGAVTDLWTIMAMGESLSWPLVFTAYAAAVPFNVLHGMGIVFIFTAETEKAKPLPPPAWRPGWLVMGKRCCSFSFLRAAKLGRSICS